MLFLETDQLMLLLLKKIKRDLQTHKQQRDMDLSEMSRCCFLKTFEEIEFRNKWKWLINESTRKCQAKKKKKVIYEFNLKTTHYMFVFFYLWVQYCQLRCQNDRCQSKINLGLLFLHEPKIIVCVCSNNSDSTASFTDLKIDVNTLIDNFWKCFVFFRLQLFMGICDGFG